LSAKFEKPIDLQHALSYPLYPYPLSMAVPDRPKRETSKSNLLHEILAAVPDKNLTELGAIKMQCGYIIDMIAQLRVCLDSVPKTFEQLASKFLQSLPKGYPRFDIVADTYRKTSIKSAERRKRGNSAKLLIIKSKVPREMNKFMLNDGNKTALIKLIFQFIIDRREEVLCSLVTEKIILSGDDETFTVCADSIEVNNESRSNQEEADTKVILHTLDVFRQG